ncbi:hypothetical protein FRC10_002073 [Ceratobasidium sp. 414]|nr:hypothetical protein FRC10_002073 [Ceratobasidium sp. 414]
MFCACTPQAVVDVAESSEMLGLMLKFVYPCSPPTIPSFEILGQGLHIADKYQLQGMKSRLRKELSLKGSAVSVFSDPLRALAFATTHDLADEAALAVSVASQSHDFHNPDDLVKLAQTMPSVAPVVKMIGMPSARTTILIEVLFQFHQRPMALFQDICFKILCDKCDKIYYKQARYGTPEWQGRWAYWVFQELNTREKKISDSDDVFTLEFFKLAMYKGAVSLPKSDCGCINLIYERRHEFEIWTAGVRECLVNRSKSLDPLEAVA